jgi:uncharacterized SAM-binding protein YcdF (DUF218 family)
MKLPNGSAIKDFGKKFFKKFFIVNGILFALLLFLSFTDLPYYAYHWLGTSTPKLKKQPELIVLLGGSGMPSPDGLIRCYYTAKAAKKNSAAEIVIALPFNEIDSLRQLSLMAHELVLRGIDTSRIRFEPIGFNTHSQAENIAKLFLDRKATLSVLIVTSPEHTYRAVKSFTAVGFEQVGGEPAFDSPVDESKVKDLENTNDTRVKSLSLRYNMWSYLNYELLVLREYAAISYYWLKGWI